MLINLTKKELMLESSGTVGIIQSVDDNNNTSDLSTLAFEGPTGFNKDFVHPFFTLLNPISLSFYRQYTTVDSSNSPYKIQNVYIIQNLKSTQFLFNPLKNLGISLNELRIGFSFSSEGHPILHLHNKIVNYLSRTSETSQAQLGLWLYCVTRLIHTCSTIRPQLVQNGLQQLCIHEKSLKDMYLTYGVLPDSQILECIPFKDDSVFSEVTYNVNANMAQCFMKGSCEYVANTITTSKDTQLIITNKSYTPHEYYIIDLRKGIIFTNSNLQPYNIFDTTEWIPYLVSNMAKVISNNTVKVKSIPVEKLFTFTDKEIKISADLSFFEKFLENSAFIGESYDLNIYKPYLDKVKITTDDSLMDFKEQYKDDAFAAKLYAQVEDYYKDIDLKDLTGILKGISKGDTYSVLFEGEAGTGKSTIARTILSRCNLPYIIVNCSVNLEESDIFGAMIPNPHKKTAEDPEFIWKDGPATLAIRNGYALIIEEIGGARPGVLMKLNSLLDESRQIDLSNGEIIKAHKNFKIIATTNIGYEGTNRLNKALVDRFEICKKFIEPTNAELIEIIKTRTGYTDTSKIDKILEVYKAIKKYSDESNLGLVISVRELLNIFRQGKYYKNAKTAVDYMLINKAFLEEPVHLDYFTQTILPAFDLSFRL